MRTVDDVAKILVDARRGLDEIHVSELRQPCDRPRLGQYLGVGRDSLVLQSISDAVTRPLRYERVAVRCQISN